MNFPNEQLKIEGIALYTRNMFDVSFALLATKQVQNPDFFWLCAAAAFRDTLSSSRHFGTYDAPLPRGPHNSPWLCTHALFHTCLNILGC